MSGADPRPAGPLPVVLAGAGNMGRAWCAAIEDDPGVELTGIADIDRTSARAAATATGRDVAVGTDAVELAAATGARAVVDATVPAAHHPVTTAALFAGLDVLGEKPVAETVAQALSLAAAAQVSGRLFMVSQSRRWNPQLFALRAMAADLGAAGTLTTGFFRAPRFGGFREEMAHPLLVDMAIHAFDAARFLLDAEPVSAYCETHNPPWSWYAGDASATAVFAMDSGARYTYTGSWCAPGAQTSWNGEWRLSAQRGAVRWDGDHEPVPDTGPAPPVAAAPSGIAAALRAFTDAVRTGATPMGEVHENVPSLAMVEAAVRSARTGRRVLIDDVLDGAHAEALRTEPHPDVRAALAGWPSAREALARVRDARTAAPP
ncbi:Gfo/Idh/MocA family protein [Pseudonocardia humida]|uniref:Gfo/Idh/MocA family oxidoreductase n=1 Tax=Pseudonocardia humida TaxID=2800819 RepID=A0ABT0ZXT6_9PSEU|nr:Gfo/Idh/MocA family oxidoreductase [Pseudonocardia humida]MCO1655560.1 Gfo/Idh/MocA family oxidoreductase [Pseudonocardia humida]